MCCWDADSAGAGAESVVTLDTYTTCCIDIVSALAFCLKLEVHRNHTRVVGLCVACWSLYASALAMPLPRQRMRSPAAEPASNSMQIITNAIIVEFEAGSMAGSACALPRPAGADQYPRSLLRFCELHRFWLRNSCMSCAARTCIPHHNLWQQRAYRALRQTRALVSTTPRTLDIPAPPTRIGCVNLHVVGRHGAQCRWSRYALSQCPEFL